jgi:hypothetical protein
MFLAAEKIPATVYEADYGLFRQEILAPGSRLDDFGPTLILVATGARDVARTPSIRMDEVAAARLVGLDLAENFDRPYLARNPIDYWNRWHISLTHWIRDYVFMASYKKAVERFPDRGKPLGYGLLFVALFLSEVWHGSTSSFAIFGAIHGLGVSANQAYADWLRKRLGRDRFCTSSVSPSCSSGWARARRSWPSARSADG